MDAENIRPILRHLFDEAVRAADPVLCIRSHLPAKPKGRTIVLGAGKASARMAYGLEQVWDGPLEGLVVTRYGHGEPCSQVRVVEAGHPVPDAAGMVAAQHMLQLARSATRDDLVICLISGGGSALLTLPPPGVTLVEKQAISRQLLASGAAIDEINRVRRHLSSIKGGRLGVACGEATVVTLVISDVPGDDPATVASGPTVADGSTPRDALAILNGYDIEVSPGIRAVLDSTRPVGAQSPGPRRYKIIATPSISQQAAADRAAALGIGVIQLGSEIEGEAREVGKVFSGIARHYSYQKGTGGAPLVILSGGETTVTLPASTPGRGGRNVEFLLSFGAQSRGLSLAAIACDTDGIDGTEDNAGAYWEGSSFLRAERAGLHPHDFLGRHDAYTFFDKLGDLIFTGPTRTNVNDFRAILLA